MIPYPIKKVWILTGDVKACYTNIPPDGCIERCAAWYRVYTEQVGNFDVSEKQVKFLLIRVLSLNFLEADGIIYKQIKGLAMGTPCAPTLANLYMAMEEHNLGLRTVKSELCMLYNRYIDDILLNLIVREGQRGAGGVVRSERKREVREGDRWSWTPA